MTLLYACFSVYIAESLAVCVLDTAPGLEEPALKKGVKPQSQRGLCGFILWLTVYPARHSWLNPVEQKEQGNGRRQGKMVQRFEGVRIHRAGRRSRCLCALLRYPGRGVQVSCRRGSRNLRRDKRAQRPASGQRDKDLTTDRS